MSSKEFLANCFFFAILAMIVIGLVFNFRYINSLENQVYQRDSLIRELSFSDQLVREYFDVQVDSLNHSRSYTLKDNKKTRIIERREYSVEIDGKKYNFDQLLQKYIKLVQEYNSLVDDYNKLVAELDRSAVALNESRQTIRSIYQKTDSLESLLNEKQYYLSSIARAYGIVCKTKREGNTIHYSMNGSPKLDSALRIFPYFKDLAVYNKEKDTWTISVPNKKRIDTIVEISYR